MYVYIPSAPSRKSPEKTNLDYFDF